MEAGKQTDLVPSDEKQSSIEPTNQTGQDDETGGCPVMIKMKLSKKCFHCVCNCKCENDVLVKDTKCNIT